MQTKRLGIWGAFTTAFLWSIASCSSAGAAAKPLAAGSRPNILLIVADDLGYTDLGVFGSEIRTSNIDKLAKSGTILTNYYTSPLCAPTRAMLLSGTDHHRAGEGRMDTHVQGAPGYEGYLNHRVVSLATRLQAVGYHTYMAGKWHLGREETQSAKTHGFERSFTLIPGGASHFDMTAMGGSKAQYREDGNSVDSLPKDFYSTVYYTDKMISYIKEHATDGKPFFAYLAYTAPHWPLQAPDEDIARQRGRYDEGYEVLRQRRFAAWEAAGFAPADAKLPNLPPDYKPWSALSPEEKARSARIMEVYAAMVERMDAEIGRVLKYLEDSGELDNTVVMFQSDNGADGSQGLPDGNPAFDNRLENIGRPRSWVTNGAGWGEASSAPHYLRKAHASEGGIHAPAIVSAPSLGIPVGRRNDSLLIASDVAPTFLEWAGTDPAAYSQRPDVLPITGRSFAGVLRGDNGANKRGPNDVLGWEHGGNAAIRKGDWKLLWVSPLFSELRASPPAGAARAEAPAMGPAPGAALSREQLQAGGSAGDPVGNGGPWKLFNAREDPAELNDLSQKHPEVMAQMLAEWNRYVAENGVIVKSGNAPR